jgi:hypothetical protein
MANRVVFPHGAGNDVREQLFDPTMSYAGSDWGRDVLAPWAAAHRPGAVAELTRIFRVDPQPFTSSRV